MILAFHTLLKEKPDIVISGINPRRQSGREHLLLRNGGRGDGRRRSIERRPSRFRWRTSGREFDFAPAAQFTRALVPMVLSEGLPPGVLLNVNVPQDWTGEVRFTRQSSKITRNVLQPGTDPRGRQYFWLSEQQFIEGIEPDTDHAAIRDGAISITPLMIDHTHAASLKHLAHWAKAAWQKSWPIGDEEAAALREKTVPTASDCATVQIDGFENPNH